MGYTKPQPLLRLILKITNQHLPHTTNRFLCPNIHGKTSTPSTAYKTEWTISTSKSHSSFQAFSFPPHSTFTTSSETLPKLQFHWKPTPPHCLNGDRRQDLVALTKQLKGLEDYAFMRKQPRDKLTRRRTEEANEACKSSLEAARSNGEIAGEVRRIKLLELLRNLPKEFSKHIRLPFCSLRRRTTK